MKGLLLFTLTSEQEIEQCNGKQEKTAGNNKKSCGICYHPKIGSGKEYASNYSQQQN